MDQRQIDRIGGLVVVVIKDAMASGLTWDEAIAAFGVASKSLAAKAAGKGNGTEADCIAHAQRCFQQGMDSTADVLREWLR